MSFIVEFSRPGVLETFLVVGLGELLRELSPAVLVAILGELLDYRGQVDGGCVDVGLCPRIRYQPLIVQPLRKFHRLGRTEVKLFGGEFMHTDSV